jgi:hypothetical protein
MCKGRGYLSAEDTTNNLLVGRACPQCNGKGFIALKPVHFKVDVPGFPFHEALDYVLADLKAFLMAKNARYGNSALDPLRVFSQADKREQLHVRMDDKLSRLVRGEDAGEDTKKDLIGYLILERVLDRMEGKKEG